MSLKIISFWAMSLLFLHCQSIPKASQDNTSSLENYLSYPINPSVGIISIHRGGGMIAGKPENCLESFDFFSRQFPSIIECDVAMSKDGQLLMMHDKTLDRTTTGVGRVSEKKWEYIKGLNLKDNMGTLTDYKVPTLDSVLTWAKGKVILSLDLKKSTPISKVLEAVKKHQAHRDVVIITYNAEQAEKVYELNPHLKISVGIMQIADYERLRARGIPDANMIAFIGTRAPKKELINYLHQKKIAVILGTLGNLDGKALASKENLYSKWQKMGVDIFATDYPIKAYHKLSHKI